MILRKYSEVGPGHKPNVLQIVQPERPGYLSPQSPNESIMNF